MEFALETLSYIFWVLIAITILVFVHEMGHFLTAKLFDMRVDRFSIGFPPKIFGKKWGETEYVIGATPLGGYVRIAGMVDESMDTEFAESEPEPREFRAKPVWQRIIVITAGVIFNVLLAIGIFTGLNLAYGTEYIPAENIDQVYVEEDAVAYDMGLRTGDRIVSINGEPVERFDNLLSLNLFTPENVMADTMTVTVERDGEQRTFTAPKDVATQLSREGGFGVSALPSLVGDVLDESAAAEIGLQSGDRIVAVDSHDVYFWNEMTAYIQQAGGEPITVRWRRADSLASGGGAPEDARLVRREEGAHIYEATVRPRPADGEDRYLLGVSLPTMEMLGEVYGRRHQSYNVGEAFVAGASNTWGKTEAIVTSLKRVVTGRDDFRENVGGPVMIAKVTKEAAEAGAQVFWNIVAILSITLAIMNILPIPALDGGHLVFLIYEGITRREPSLRVRMALQQIGMILLVALMVFVIFNDILRL